MNKKQTIIGILVLIILAALCWIIFNEVVIWFRTLDTSIAATLTTALFGLIGLWYAQWHSKSRDIAESHRASKIEVYSTFFDIVEKFQAQDVTQEELNEENLPDWLRNDFAKLNRGLILWASPNVISAWLKFRAVSSSGGNIILAMDQMYKAIRKGLGNSNFGLNAGDLIRIGLKDPNELEL
ncbi:MAG: hypothetical protein WBL28_09275 [Methylotenera sp.]